ncbi:BMP family ABC transporter substrate-binding protein [Sedimentitalea sp. XS_ASV28]|uniref:BMP family ABC transporter substrate-binding protein n=1 Tax=Sedimentitalea sp. XS_ASV28 TaxID=3241296 RepID=UPI003518808E
MKIRWIKTLIAGGAALMLGTGAIAEPLKIGMVVASPVGDVGWARNLVDGMDAVKQKYGDDVEITVIENIAEGPDADRAINQLAADGHKFLMLGSFGYMNAALKLARQNPEISILHASGYKTSSNMSAFTAKYFQGSYLLGMAAAGKTESKKLGVVAAFAIPEFITTINAFTLGAQRVDPDIEVNVVWVNTWFDPAKEQSAAEALIAKGADVVFSMGQDTPSVVSLAEREGVYVTNLNSSMKDYAPNYYLGVNGTDWAPFFLEQVADHMNGTFEGRYHWLGIEDDVVVTTDFNENTAPDLMAQIEEVQTLIESQDFKVFKGPLTNQAGEIVVPEGTVLSDNDILGMTWHVKGVTSPLPK